MMTAQGSLFQETANCERCGVPCRVAATSNPDARILQHATEPQGVCANCGVTATLLMIPPIAMAIEMRGKEILLDPRVRLQFMQVMMAGNADAKPYEITWQIVVDNWELPFPKKQRKRKSR